MGEEEDEMQGREDEGMGQHRGKVPEETILHWQWFAATSSSSSLAAAGSRHDDVAVFDEEEEEVALE